MLTSHENRGWEPKRINKRVDMVVSMNCGTLGLTAPYHTLSCRNPPKKDQQFTELQHLHSEVAPDTQAMADRYAQSWFGPVVYWVI